MTDLPASRPSASLPMAHAAAATVQPMITLMKVSWPTRQRAESAAGQQGLKSVSSGATGRWAGGQAARLR